MYAKRICMCQSVSQSVRHECNEMTCGHKKNVCCKKKPDTDDIICRTNINIYKFDVTIHIKQLKKKKNNHSYYTTHTIGHQQPHKCVKTQFWFKRIFFSSYAKKK